MLSRHTTTPDVGPTPKDFEVKVETDRADADVVEGEPMTLRVTVKNNGKAPAFRVRAARHQPHGVAAGVAIEAGERMDGHGPMRC